jgi:heme-degrading monooxygenase HmoA
MDEAVAIFKDSVAPAIHGWRGLQIGRLLGDRAGNKIMAVSFWDSQADEASLTSSSSYQEAVAKFAALFAGPPEVEVFEEAVEI